MMVRLGLAALAASMVATPALAGNSSDTAMTGKPLPAITGDVSLGFGAVSANTDIEFDPSGSLSPSQSMGLLRGYGRVNVPLDDRWNFEFEATGQSEFGSGAGNSIVGANGHVWAKLPDAAFGAFGGLSTGHSLGMCPFPGCSVSPSGNLQSATAGIEGEAYFGNLTVGGQASTSWNTLDMSIPVGRSADFQTWQVRGYAQYYFTPDDKLTGEVKYNKQGLELRLLPLAVPYQDSWQFTGRLEHRFAGTPWSIWASGAYETIADDGLYGVRSISQNRWTALVGFQLFMDAAGSTLQGHDRQIPFHYDNNMDLIWEVEDIP